MESENEILRANWSEKGREGRGPAFESSSDLLRGGGAFLFALSRLFGAPPLMLRRSRVPKEPVNEVSEQNQRRGEEGRKPGKTPP